jgi:phenylalanyl-tRNA synthetase beta chain
MKVSLNTVKQYTDIEGSVDELVAKINAQLGGVEKVTDLGKRYEGATIVKIIECNNHPNADRLHVCKIDDGGVTSGVDRDENGLIQVVCGAPNVQAGMFVVWLPPKSTVPASFNEKELFVLEARELRGVVSNGMLASAKELAIGESHEGILEINPTEWKPVDVEIKPGTSFAEAYGLNDTIIEIENKMFTHRPDCFGQLGVAREIAGIQHKPFKSPDWYVSEPHFTTGRGLDLEVGNEAEGNVSRFMAVAIKDIEVKPSPLWLQCELVRLGSKPINNIVDVTNYVMLLTAQPLHAYDYDKLRGHKLGARMAVDGETLPLLNGKTYELRDTDIVIIDGEGPVGLGGIMGGGNSEVSSDTKNIVLECATFDMYTLRKTSMRHGLFTDAVTRFNKGQSPLQNSYVLSLAMQSIFDTAGGEQATEVFDNKSDKVGLLHKDSISIDTNFVSTRLGLKISTMDIQQLLENVELPVTISDEALSVTKPFWRTDLELREDVVEEIGRLYGFDKLPRELPLRTTKPAKKNARRELAQALRENLARAGANEVLTYSFVHEKFITHAGQDVAEAFKLSNALSPDLQYYRLSLTPSLLDKINANIKAGHQEFALFEVGKAHSKRADVTEEGLPAELRRIALVFASKNIQDGAPYYRVKRILDFVADSLGLTLAYKPLPAQTSLAAAKPFEPKRSARVVDEASGQAIGIIGEYTARVRKNFKLPDYVAGFELLPEAIELAMHHKRPAYVPLSRYPSSERDICYQVNQSVAYGDLIAVIKAEAQSNETVAISMVPVDIYQSAGSSVKNITVRLTLLAKDRTLSGDEVTTIVNSLSQGVETKLGATVI